MGTLLLLIVALMRDAAMRPNPWTGIRPDPFGCYVDEGSEVNRLWIKKPECPNLFYLGDGTESERWELFGDTDSGSQGQLVYDPNDKFEDER